MGRKKLSLKPVQRGVATTSVASKKPPPLEQEPNTEGPNEENSSGDFANVVKGPSDASKEVAEDWEEEISPEEAALQAVFERLQDKGEKEVARVIKSIEFDRRLSSSFPRLDINRNIRDQILAFALDEDDRVEVSRSVNGNDDKALQRLFVAWQVLQYLGFSEERIKACLIGGIGDGEGWEEALKWMWLHLSEDECLSQGEFARKQEPTLEPSDDPLIAPSIPVQSDVPAPKAVETSRLSSSMEAPTGPPAQSLFEPAGDDAAEDESDADLDVNKINSDWATIMLRLDTLRLEAGAGQGKRGKKLKSSGVVLETPEMRSLKERAGKIEREYMFSRKDADAILKSLKSQRDAQALEANLKGKPHDSAMTGETTPSDDGLETDMLAFVGSDNEDPGLFGKMLDEPAVQSTDEAPATSNHLIQRSMPIPKQFAFAGNTPKTLLRSALGKSTKSAVMSYVHLSGGSRAARAGLEITWSASKRRVWKMEDIACDNLMEAENYVSTLALYDLGSKGEVDLANWKTMPTAYRDLWEELGQIEKARLDAEKKLVWKTIMDILAQRPISNGQAAAARIINQNGAAEKAFATTGYPRPDEPHSERLQAEFERRRNSSAFQHMLQSRNQLPIAAFRQEIVNTVNSSQVMVLSGETGCGKSTQLPSFILEDQLAQGRSCKIFVTEPRRISAISLAQRVSQELGDAPGAMGTNSSLVGYSIRLEAKVATSTRLAFVTNGIALRMLESGTNGTGKGTAFDEVTHIIVDEVHERSIESDFLLIVLKQLMQLRRDLKVVLMSATLDAEKISDFFGGCPCLTVPGRTFPVQVNYLEDAVELSHWHIDESSPYAVWQRSRKAGAKQLEWTDENARAEDEDEEEGKVDPTKLSAAKYSARTVDTVNLLDSRQIPYDLIVKLLEHICFEEQDLTPFSAAILVFMPGLAEIRKLNDMLGAHSYFGSTDFIIYPLHSTISSEGQSQVFEVPPPGIRKIVISTNIAETGVTIPDVTCVIDSGKHREMRYDEKRQISRLVETYIARSNAKQRRGRAGRVQEGLAFHLFTKARHDAQMAEHPIPEMLRLSLQDLALRIKILRLNLGTSIENVLTKALDPPSALNIQRAVAALVEVKALTTTEEITPLGHLLAKLPMDVHLGKFLLVATLFRCLDPALTIAATLNSKSPFVTPFGLEHAADTAKQGFKIGNSDFLTIANVFDCWRKASDNPHFVKTWCKRNFVSQQNLQQIEELRQQLLAYLVDSGFAEASVEEKAGINQARYQRGSRTRFVSVPIPLNINASQVHTINAALAAGLYPKLLSVDAAGGLKTISNQQPISIHPSSVNFRTPRGEYGTNYLVYFTIMQSKKLYAWEVGGVEDRALALLVGDSIDFRPVASSIQIDRKLRYQVEPKTLVALKWLREKMSLATSTRMRGKALTESQVNWFDLGLQCLMTGLWDDEKAGGMIAQADRQ